MSDMLKNTQLQADIVTLLQLAIERKASDLILTVGLPPMLRIDGEWGPTEYEHTLYPYPDAPLNVLHDGREKAARV